MLRKLLKYEWRATSKVMLIMDSALVLLTLIGCFILNTDIFDRTDAIPMAILMVTLYALSLTALGIATLFYLYFRFYRNLYSREGYLMHTLPVTPMQLFHAKLLVGYIWTLLNSALIMVSIICLFFVAGYHFAMTHGMDGVGQIIEKLSLESPANENGINFFYEMFGYTPLEFFQQLSWLQLIGSFVSLLTGYVSILLGQLIEKYKLMASVGFYIALYIINQIVCSILMIMPGLQVLMQDTDNFLYSYYRYMMAYAILSQFVMGLVFYAAAVFLMRRRVNLD